MPTPVFYTKKRGNILHQQKIQLHQYSTRLWICQFEEQGTLEVTSIHLNAKKAPYPFAYTIESDAMPQIVKVMKKILFDPMRFRSTMAQKSDQSIYQD